MSFRVPRHSDRITYVCGPPGSGKTTYARQHAGERDLVWDLDEVAAAICPAYATYEGRPPGVVALLNRWRSSLIASLISKRISARAWVIVTSEGMASDLCRRSGGVVVRMPRIAGESAPVIRRPR